MSLQQGLRLQLVQPKDACPSTASRSGRCHQWQPQVLSVAADLTEKDLRRLSRRNAHSIFHIPTKQKRRSPGQGAQKPLDHQRPEKWVPENTGGHEHSRPQQVPWLPAYGVMSATSIPVSCDGVKTHVFMDNSTALRGDMLRLSLYACHVNTLLKSCLIHTNRHPRGDETWVTPPNRHVAPAVSHRPPT